MILIDLFIAVSVVFLQLVAMLISNSISVLRKVNAIVGWIYRDFSVQIPGWRKQHIPGSQVLSRTNIWANVCIRRFLSDLSDSTSSSDDDIDELCIYEPDVRRIRIVTRNDMYANDLMEDAASSPPSVHRDTVYTRQNVTDDDPAVQSLFRGICEGSRSALARAITLTESVHPRRRAEAQVLMREVLEHTRKKRTHSLHRVNSFRIGKDLSVYPTIVALSPILFCALSWVSCFWVGVKLCLVHPLHTMPFLIKKYGVDSCLHIVKICRILVVVHGEKSAVPEGGKV